MSGLFSLQLVWSAIKAAATFGVWVTIFLVCIFGWFALDLPDADQAFQATRRPTVTILASDGSVFATRGDLYGLPFHLRDLPVALPNAVISTEDRRFRSHFGIDPFGIVRAAWANIKAGRIVQGGSTLTQQAAKNLFLTPEQSYKRKIQEIILAFWMERKFTKDQILTIYLNRVYFGAGTYGVDAAARRYFGKSITEVTTYEAALLAGLLKAPSRYNPIASPIAAAKRTRQVLLNMVAAGYLTDAEVNAIIRRPIRRYRPPAVNGRYFADWVLQRLGDYVTVGKHDLVVRTTLDPGLQRVAERYLSGGLSNSGKIVKAGQGALVTMTRDGAVQALVGGRSHAESPFNRATQATRQPGSAFKPFVYLAALEAGYKPSSPVDDLPIEIDGWKPRNFNGRYRGRISLSEALAISSNAAAARIGQEIGFGKIASVAARLGVPGNISPRPSLTLGTHDMSLIDLTAAYAPFANGGTAAWPFGILQIENDRGVVLFNRVGSGLGRVVDAEDAASMSHMLSGVIKNGTGRAAALARPAAGKTGTSQNHRDAWFIGYTADLITGVWVGNDNGAPMEKVTGGGLPAHIWRNFMSDAHAGMRARELAGIDGARPIRLRNSAHTQKKPLAKRDENDFVEQFLGFLSSLN
ncbi:MAG: hypothetical protein CBB68_08855 [Rhodospirillaceae bacterium TMED8]|nr:penicillin-binding protein [Magnetovibrio sp.]OUT50471.1 MAG: hypothetical protein CBB68_08855 [Rhodospirillaceae bacterium TMED8]